MRVIDKDKISFLRPIENQVMRVVELRHGNIGPIQPSPVLIVGMNFCNPT